MKLRFFGRPLPFAHSRKGRRFYRLLVIFLIFVLLVGILTGLYRSAAPIAAENARLVSRGHLESVVNQAVARVIEKQNYTYESFVHGQTDGEGKLVFVAISGSLLAKTRSEIVDEIHNTLTANPSFSIAVPLGSLIAPKVFTGKGLGVKINAMTYAAVSARLFSQVEAVGINQTFHTLTVEITLETALYCMNRRQDLTFTYSVPLASSLYFGNIPSSFFGSMEE